MGLEGKTIARVEERDYGSTVRLWFTDGTAADLEGHSYEDVDITTKMLGPEEFERERVEAEQAAVREAAEKERRVRRAAEWEVKRADMERICSPQQYERWLDSERPMRKFHAAMKAEFEGAIHDQLKATNRLLFG